MTPVTKQPYNLIADTSAHNIGNTHTRSLWQRSLVAIALLLTCAFGIKAEQYVIYYQNGDTKYYLANNNGTLTSTDTYVAATCIWEGESGSTFSNDNKKIYLSYYSLTTSENGSSLTIDGEGHIYRTQYDINYYIYYNTNTQKFSASNTNTAYAIAAAPPTSIIEPTSIKITPDNLSLSVGETATVTYTITPDGAYDEDVRFNIANDAIASIAAGVVTAKAAGTTTLTVTAYDSKGGGACSATCTITVQDNGPQFVDEAGVAAAKANLVVGVGYPKTTSEAYINLNNLTANTKTQAEVNALVTAYKSCPDIQLPEDGKAYTFTALFKDDKRYHMNYTAGVKMKVSDAVTASTFVCVELRTINDNEKVYAFVIEDGHILTWIGNDEGGAYKENGNIYGYSSEYATEYDGQSDWNEITVKKNDTHVEQFGLLRLVGRRHSTATSAIIANTNKRFDQANDGNWFNSDNTSGWIVTEVPYPTGNTDVEYAVAQIRAKEAEKYKTPAPKFVVDMENKCFYLNCTEQEGTIYYTTDGSDPTDPANNPTVLTQGQSIAFTSGTIKAYAHKAGYTPSDVVEQVAEIIEIDTAEKLAAIAANGYYIVTADITVTSHTSITNFTGVFDGGFHTISSLNAPLFANTDGAIIKNVTLKDVDISGTGSAGAIATTATGATRIYNCGVLSGNISGTSNVGSIAGELRGTARVINCYSYANITGGTTVGGIVGNNSVAFTTADALQTLVMNCIYYGELAGTSIYPIFGGKNITNNLGVNTYNFFRYNDATKYAGYNRAQAITEDSYLDRFEFYRHILNSHRELAAIYCFDDVDQYEEIDKWVLDTEIAAYPIIQEWKANTKKTLDRNIPFTANDYAGKQVGSVSATVIINGSSRTVTLPITDMDTVRWDYTYGKVVLPFANEFKGWSIDANKAITGWKISTKDYYQDLNATFDNTEYVYAQGGNYIVPNGVESITLTAYVAPAVYLSDASYDVVYNSSYASPQGRGGTTPTTYKGQTVYTNLAAAIDALTLDANTVRPYQQAIVLVGNYHYNQRVERDVLPNAYEHSWFNTNKPFTLMSVDNNNDQEPDYCFYQYHSVGPGRSLIHPVRFDFLTSPGIGMAAHIEEGSAVPGIGIWHCKGWYEQTETYLGIMNECEMRPANFLVESPWILNGGIFEEINVSSTNEYGNQKESKLSYIKIGGNALVNKFYPGVQHANNNSYVTTLKPVYVSGGEVKSCYMTGKQPQYTTTVGNVDFYCNGGYIHEFLGAYMEPLATNATINVRADHALIDNFYGGGANENYGTPGNINITMNNSRVNFFCGGPKYGNMSDGKTITINASGSTFGQFYGGGYGGTALTRNMKATSSPDFSGELTYPHDFTNYTDDRLQSRGLGIGVGYDFEFFLYAGGGSNGGGKGVARFFVDYAKLSLATVGSITSTLTNCTILGDYYGGGCQGRVEGDVTSTLTDCTVNGNIFAGGYTAAATPCYVYPITPPTYSTFKSTLGIFTPFGTTPPDTCVWAQATAGQAAGTVSGNTIYTDVDMTKMGEVNGNTVITVSGNSYVAGAVYGGGNESKVTGTTTVHINATDGGNRINNVFGGANQADVNGATTVNINSGNIGNVFGANNKSGTKGSTIEVNVKGATSDYVYGAGNLAAYTGNPVVNMSAGTVKNALYGGGLGKTAVVTGNPQVNMTGGTVGYTEKVDGKDVVRGGDVFGGGNAAAVDGNTGVTITAGEVKRNVYGGGNQANVTGKTNVVIGQ